MEKLSTGVFKVVDGEVVTFDVSASGTLFGVNHRVSGGGGGGPLTQDQPLNLTMNKEDADEESEDVPNARTTVVTLTFNFSNKKGGRYDWTITGSEGGTDTDFTRQAGSGPRIIRFLFHIV